MALLVFFLLTCILVNADEGADTQKKLSGGISFKDTAKPAPAPVPAGASLEDRVKFLEEKIAQNAVLQQKVQSLAEENESLKSKLNALEGQVNQVKLAPSTASNVALPAPAEKPKTILDTVKLKGRFAAGFLKTAQGNNGYGAAGAATQPQYSHGSFEVPEAKLQLSLSPDPINTVVMRANLNNATFNSLDTFCLDSKDYLPIPENIPLTVATRLGRFKMPYGEEMWTNDFVNSATTDSSAGNPTGYDEGLQVSGKIGKENPVLYALSVTNGQGTGSGTATTRDNYFPKAFIGRLGYQLFDPLYVSGSVYASGGLGTSSCDMTFGGTGYSLTTNSLPTGATGWKRNMWEVDARYDIGKGKIATGDLQGAYTDSTAYVRGAFGQLYDLVDGPASNREANYGYVEGLWNFHPKVYSAFRYSIVDVMNSNYATINNLQFTKRYDRYSLGLGYRWTDKTIIRLAYEFNAATLASAPINTTNAKGANDDLLALTVGTTF